MPDNDEKSKLIVELKPCIRCGNAFMIKQGEELDELVCENCIKIEQRKRALQLGVLDQVIEVENKMEDSINQMKTELTDGRGPFNKHFFLEKIKKRAQCLQKSIELVEKIEETNDEKYIEEYKSLFHKMKKEIS